MCHKIFAIPQYQSSRVVVLDPEVERFFYLTTWIVCPTQQWKRAKTQPLCSCVQHHISSGGFNEAGMRIIDFLVPLASLEIPLDIDRSLSTEASTSHGCRTLKPFALRLEEGTNPKSAIREWKVRESSIR